MKLISLCIDARMKNSSGIGTYLRNLIPVFQKSEKFSITLLEETKVAPYSLKEQLFLPQYIPRCDLFWSPHFNVPLLPIRASKRIVTIHDVFLITPLSPLKPYEKWYARLLLTRAVKTASLIMTDSEFSKREIQKYLGVQKEKIHVIYLGIDQDLFSHQVDPKKGQDVLKKYGIFQPYILFVGNLKPHKNIQGLLDAYALWLKRQGRQEHLILIGQAFDSFPIREFVYRNEGLRGQVHFLHAVTDQELSVFYQKAFVTVLPSFYEGFGFPPLEAMSAKSPVIVSSKASLEEVCGQAALYIDPESPESLYAALEKVKKESGLREKLICLGTLRARNFCWEAAGKSYVEHFLNLLI